MRIGGFLLPSCEESIDGRFKVRFYFSRGSRSPLSHGYSVKLTLIDEQNLLLYQNILELSYSSVNRSVKDNSRPTRTKSAAVKTSWNEKTLKLMSRNFVEEATKLIGDEYRLPVKRALKKIGPQIEAIIRS